jgi:ribose transport system permease protein
MVPMSATEAGAERRRRILSLELLLGRYGVFFVLVVLVIGCTVLSPLLREGQQLFLTGPNLINIAQQASINAIIAVGMTFVIISGGIDLSVGSMVAFSGVVAAIVMRDFPAEPWGGFIVAVLMAGLCGFSNGLLITRLDLPPFIVTLGTLGIFRGLAQVVGDGRSVYQFDRVFGATFAGRVGPIPVPVIVAGIVALIFAYVLAYTRLGKYAIAIGGSEETARLAGIAVRRYKLVIYTLGGLLVGVASALQVARFNSGDPTFGDGFELDAIASVVMGGTSLSGGQGTIAGTIVGALTISTVRNAMNIFRVPSYWQQVVIGGVIVLAVILDQWRKRRAARS